MQTALDMFYSQLHAIWLTANNMSTSPIKPQGVVGSYRALIGTEQPKYI